MAPVDLRATPACEPLPRGRPRDGRLKALKARAATLLKRGTGIDPRFEAAQAP